MKIISVKFAFSSGKLSQIPRDGIREFAFIGRSNVGKSSLINMLAGQRGLAKVSGTPGKTRLINHFLINDEWYLVDLPGYGYAKVSKTEKARWGRLIEGYFHQDRDLRLVFLLIDMRHPPTNDDLQMIDFLVESEIPFALALTKRDKLSRRQEAERLAALKTEIPYADQVTLLPFSAETGEGLEQIMEIIEDVTQ